MIRTTGPRSQNKRIHGHCADIAEQLGVKAALVYQVICIEAVEESIIAMRVVMGRAVPVHESEWGTDQAANVIMLIHRKADELGLWLTEYGEDGVPMRMKFGAPWRTA